MRPLRIVTLAIAIPALAQQTTQPKIGEVTLFGEERTSQVRKVGGTDLSYQRSRQLSASVAYSFLWTYSALTPELRLARIHPASNASRRTAANRTLIVEGARFFCSRKKRYRSTTVRLNARRGSEQYQPINSSIA